MSDAQRERLLLGGASDQQRSSQTGSTATHHAVVQERPWGHCYNPWLCPEGASCWWDFIFLYSKMKAHLPCRIKQPRMSSFITEAARDILMKETVGERLWRGQCFTPERAQGQGGVCPRQALRDMSLRPMAAGSWSRNSGLAVGELIFSFSLRPLEFALMSVLSGWRMALILFLEVCCLVWGPTLIYNITRCSSRCQMKWRLFSLSTRHSEGAGFVLRRSFQLALVWFYISPSRYVWTYAHIWIQTPPLGR